MDADVDRQTAFALGLRRPSASLLPPHTDVEHEPHPFVASLADTLHSLPGAPLAGDAIVLSAAEVLRLPEGAPGREEALQATAAALARSRTASALDPRTCASRSARSATTPAGSPRARAGTANRRTRWRRPGPNHAALVAPLHNEGIALARLGRSDDARARPRARPTSRAPRCVGGLHGLRADLVAGIVAHQAEAGGGAAEEAYARARARGEVAAAAAAPHFCCVGLAELLQQAGGEKARRDRTATTSAHSTSRRAAPRSAALAAEPPESARCLTNWRIARPRGALRFALRRPVDAAAALAEAVRGDGREG